MFKIFATLLPQSTAFSPVLNSWNVHCCDILRVRDNAERLSENVTFSWLQQGNTRECRFFDAEFPITLTHETAEEIEMYLPRFLLSLPSGGRMLTMQILFSIRERMVSPYPGGRQNNSL
jgi:hypothetical protein